MLSLVVLFVAAALARGLAPAVTTTTTTTTTTPLATAPTQFRPVLLKGIVSRKKTSKPTVRVSIRYSGGAKYATKVFARVKQVITHRFDDVVVEKRVRYVRSLRNSGLFEILVDDRLVYSKPPERDGIFLSMRTLSQAINRARLNNRRPAGLAAVYGATRD